jgi:hypothetical protein
MTYDTATGWLYGQGKGSAELILLITGEIVVPFVLKLRVGLLIELVELLNNSSEVNCKPDPVVD